MIFNFLKPDKKDVESRLHQIKDYIKVTSTMMNSLSQCSDPVSIIYMYCIVKT